MFFAVEPCKTQQSSVIIWINQWLINGFCLCLSINVRFVKLLCCFQIYVSIPSTLLPAACHYNIKRGKSSTHECSRSYTQRYENTWVRIITTYQVNPKKYVLGLLLVLLCCDLLPITWFNRTWPFVYAVLLPVTQPWWITQLNREMLEM